jgi:hypothetical protein
MRVDSAESFNNPKGGAYRAKKTSLKANFGVQENLRATGEIISKKKLAGWKWLSR